MKQFLALPDENGNYAAEDGKRFKITEFPLSATIASPWPKGRAKNAGNFADNYNLQPVEKTAENKNDGE